MYQWINKITLAAIIFTLSSVAFGEEKNKFDNHFVYSNYAKKISMDFKDAALVDVLKAFSKQSGMNFITPSELGKKRVTLFLENIPMEEALDQILKANGLVYEMQGDSDIFFVKESSLSAKKIITRVYPLKYATVPSSKLNKTITIGSTASSTTGSILDAIKAVLTPSGKMVEDTRSNSLIISDEEGQFALIEETIAKLDVIVPEILIEVEMLDVSKNTTDLMGVKFGDAPFSFAGASKGTLYPFNQSQIFKKQTDSPDPIEYTAGTISATGMTAVLNFLRTQTDTRNLARPRLLTLNNETAEIKISTNEAIGLTKTASTTAGGSTAETPERVQTGVFLTVTPQANLATGEILMAVYPKVIQARAGSITSNGQVVKDPEERGSQSILRVKDGETIIIGGLLRTDDTLTITKVPFLGDIPFVGGAFRHKNKVGITRELMIFITPHILDEKKKSSLFYRNVEAIAPENKDKPSRSNEVNKALSTMERKRF